ALDETTPRLHADRTARRKSSHFFPALGALTLIALSLYASQTISGPAETVRARPAAQKENDVTPTAKAVAAAKKFLDSLDDKQRAKAVFDFDSTKKAGWSNLPITNVPRNGVRTGDMTKPQHDAALELLAAVLSKEGYQKIIDIMNADEELATGKGKGKGGKGGGKGGAKTSFGNANYFLAIFGPPSMTQPWFVQFGGHHLGLNVTIVEKSLVLTPTHTGAQPVSYTRDGKTVRPLGGENDKAFQLIGALDDTQRAQAAIKDKNLVLGPGQDGKKITPQGIKGSALTAAQQAQLLDLIGEWVNIIHQDAAAPRMAEIKANLADTYFGWNGPTTNGSAAYYRIQGPTLVIEYAPQGGIDHIHTVIRDPSNDYGQKLMKR
ncbi:MAG TPA: DUF3500 domain-containing protein, partial [Gemmataceae bacterium]|nr:DUF3500 domain-containing protein [Gemmataceae bacterium]